MMEEGVVFRTQSKGVVKDPGGCGNVNRRFFVIGMLVELIRQIARFVVTQFANIMIKDFHHMG